MAAAIAYWLPVHVEGMKEHGGPSCRQLLDSFNIVQTGCIVKGEAQKSPLFWRFLGPFDFLKSACSLEIQYWTF